MKRKIYHKIKEEREIEIELVKKTIKKGGILLNGKRGAGKTTVLKVAAKDLKMKLHEIDTLNISEKDLNGINLFTYLSWKGKGKWLFFNFLNHFIRYFLPIISIYMVILGPVVFATNAIASNVSDTLKAMILLMPIFVVGFYFLFLLTILLINLKKKIILFSEINFLSNPERINPFVWRVKKLHKRDIFAFESTNNINEYTRMKYNLYPIDISSGLFVIKPFDDTVKRIFNLYSEINKPWVTQSVNRFRRCIEDNNFYLSQILSKFSYREMEQVSEHMFESFVFLKGEINPYDFILSSYLKIYQPDLMQFIFENVRELGNASDHMKRNRDVSQPKPEVLVKYDELVNNIKSKFEKDFIENRNWFAQRKTWFSSSGRDKFHFALDKYNFTPNYFATSIYGFLHGDLIDMFSSDPIEFLKYVKQKKINIREVDFGGINAEIIINFYKVIDGLSEESLLEINPAHASFGDVEPINLIPFCILKSIEEHQQKVSLVKSLPKKIRVIFAKTLFEENTFAGDIGDNIAKAIKDLDLQNFNIDDIPTFIRFNRLIYMARHTEYRFNLVNIEQYFMKLLEKKWVQFAISHFISYESSVSSSKEDTYFHQFYIIRVDEIGENLYGKILNLIFKHGNPEWNIYALMNGAVKTIREVKDLKLRFLLQNDFE